MQCLCAVGRLWLQGSPSTKEQKAFAQACQSEWAVDEIMGIQEIVGVSRKPMIAGSDEVWPVVWMHELHLCIGIWQGP